MAQKTDIRLRRSDTAGKIPTSANLSDGELAINTGSGALYFKKSDGTIITAHDNTILHIDSDTTGSSTTGTNPKVGIGTTSPSGNLHIKSVGNVGDALLIVEADADNNVESDNPRIELRQDSNLVSGALYLEGNAAATATNSIQNSLLLDAKASSSDGGILQFATGGLAANQSGGPTNSSVRMTILRDGNVGIGTTSPDAKLQVTGADISGTTPGVSGDNYFSGGTGDTNYLEFSTFNTISPNAGHRINVSNSTGALYLGVNASDVLVLAANGNVGIGTDSPDRALEVDFTGNTVGARFTRSDTTGSSTIEFANSAGVKSTIGFNAGTNKFDIKHNAAVRLSVDNNGAVTFNEAFTFPTSIGTSGQVLKVPSTGSTLVWADDAGGGSATVLTDTDGDTKIQVEESADEDVIRFDVAGSEIVTMTDDGVILNDGYNFEGDVVGATKFKAQAGEALTIGDVVYISGISGNTVIVSKADANDSAKMPAFGLAGSTVSLNAAVEIVTFGTLLGVDTSTPSFALGEELYVSTTAGELTNSAPTGSSSLIQKIGKVTRVDASAGSIKVMGAGRTNATPNLDEGRLFVGNSSNQSVQGDDTLYVDMANSRVGINTTNPSQALSVDGNIYSIGGFVNASGYQLNGTYIVDSSRNLVNIAAITTSGNVTVGGKIYAKDSNSTTDPTYTFTGHTNTGLAVYQVSSIDRLSIITGGAQRANFGTHGVESFANVYTGNTSAFRNYGGEWHATTGVTGNGFRFTNTADSVDALVLTAAGNATFAGTISSGAITSSGASSGRYTGLEVVNTTNAGGTETAIGLGVVAAGNSACDVKLVANRVGANSGSDFYIEQTDSSGSQQETFRITESGNATFAGTISSGDITVNTLSSGNQITIQSPTPSIEFIDANATTRKAKISAENGNLLFEADTNTGEANTTITFKMDGGNALAFDSSKNATFAGQIHLSGSSSLRSNNPITFNTIGGAAQAGKFLSVAAQTSYANGASDGMFNALNGYAVGTGTGTTVIDSSRNLTNIGTISSGAITSTGAIQGASFSDGTISGITFIDEDSFATNSATRVPTQQSIKAYVDAQVAGVVDSAPAALDTLNELAAALGDDANFSTTTSTALGNRLRVDTASQGLTGTQQANAITNLGITATKAELNVLDGITATVTELNYTDGVTSNIQTQFTSKLNLSGGTMTGSIAMGTNNITGVDDLTFTGANSTISIPSHSGIEIDITGSTAGNIRANAELYLLSQTSSLNLGASGTNGLLKITNSETVINDGSFAYNFRVESNNNANMIHVDGTNDRVGIGRDPSTHAFEVQGHADFKSNMTIDGALTATSKSFDIEHPTKEGMRLHHGVLEGPEHAVYIRGKSNSYIIELPDYWEGLVHEDTITVQLTPIGGQNDMWIENIEDNKVYINCEREMKQYFYFIQAERKDIERFEVEYGNSV